MIALAAALALLAAPPVAASTEAAAEPGPASAPIAIPAPAPVATPAADPATPPAPAAPVAPAAAPEGAEKAPRKEPVAPTQALLDKMGQGDRMVLAGDHRGALFVYQDAVYLQPRYAPARVRLGRAYLALRYPEQALAQAEAALAEDPDSAEARKLLEDARNAPPRAKSGAAAAEAPAATPAPAAPAAARQGPRVFKLTPEGEGAAADAAASRATAPGAGLSAAPGGAVVAPVVIAPPVAVTEVTEPAGGPGPKAAAAEPAAQPQVAAQHYRTALGFLQNREWAKAVAALSDAILADPTLAVAFAARGSAQFGLGKYRDAAEDYAAAIRLDGNLGTPIYGLAECYRVLGEGKKAAEMYERYARSTSADVREDLKAIATKRAKELR
jgi:tetratricopeptide (TPR) repeat protein